ncbi:hypothetical protein DFP72DRAFT_126594 [Ephemerocybe angulata]|uniref:Uncharacterized protein n=1 Tax=Ephemerocybe angulata TaxID=980116 RepID=A0A8H6HAF9_9AGAR|nr:hypothetical protein DFP72DRAFT_126594 [Tulosesus angulatus]
MDYGRLAPGASYHLSNHTNYGSNQRGGGTEKDGGGYAPVNPFEASVALGVKKILGKAKDRTIDQVEVQSPNRPYAAGYAGAGPAGYAQPALMERGPHFYTPYQQPQYPVPPHPYYPALNVAEGNAWHGPPGVPQYLNPRTSSPPRRRRSRSRSNRGAPFSLPQGVEIIPPRRPRSSSRAHVHYSEPSRHRSPSPALRNHYIYDRLSRSPRRAPSRDDRADRAWYRPGARSRSWGDRRSRSRFALS